MDGDWLTQFLQSLRGYNVNRRCGDDNMEDMSMQKKICLCKMEELEVLMFKPSVDIVTNKKSGEIVMDDWLIGSRAADIGKKSKSERKVGRDGPVADGIACSHTGCLFG